MNVLRELDTEVGTMADQSASPFFSKLPPEIRRSIYDECLYVGEVAAYALSTTESTRPLLSLLHTCKKVKLEAESALYKNTIVLRNEGAVSSFIQETLQTPARKLLPKSIEVSLRRDDFTPQDSCMAYNHAVTRAKKVRGASASSSSIDQYNNRQVHRFTNIQLRDMTWQRKLDPILDNLTLDRLVLDLSDSFCEDDDCKCRMAAMAILCFKKGFALQAPKAVEVKWWDAGRPDVDAVVLDCLGVWTTRRATRVAGSVGSALDTVSEAEKWLLEVAREEEEN